MELLIIAIAMFVYVGMLLLIVFTAFYVDKCTQKLKCSHFIRTFIRFPLFLFLFLFCRFMGDTNIISFSRKHPSREWQQKAKKSVGLQK